MLRFRAVERLDSAPLIQTDANSQARIETRAAAGQISWTGPLLLLVARSALLIASQGLMAGILWMRGSASPWHEAGYWWNIYGTLVDVGCLAGMAFFLRREGLRLRDLLGPIRLRHGRDLFLGLGYFVLVFPLFVVSGYLAQRWLYGAAGGNPGDYVFAPHTMPLWALVYSLSVWWMIWSPTEEATYQAYVMPRLRALTGHTWLAFVLVAVWWAAQHAALPFVPDARFVLFRLLAFLPGAAALMAIYWRTRRLAPVVIAHWPMDIAGALMTGVLANLR